MLITDGKKDKKMGMFDDIIVPKSYLKGLLTKEQEKLIKDNNYQTKCLENSLAQYKVYKQKHETIPFPGQGTCPKKLHS